MPNFRATAHYVGAALLFATTTIRISPAQSQPKTPKFPYPEKLTYNIEWRMVMAGTASLGLYHAGANAWQLELDLESAGLVSRLYRVLDKYRVFSDDHFCASSANLDAQEGKKHTITQLRFDAARRKVVYDEKDLVKNASKHDEIDMPPCAHEIAGALASLREIDLPPGKSTSVPVTDGKKMVMARIEAQGKETVAVGDQKYQTIRYEAFVFDNVLYRRKGRLFFWLTDDADRVPVQFRVQLGFPVGTISLSLEKHEKL